MTDHPGDYLWVFDADWVARQPDQPVAICRMRGCSEPAVANLYRARKGSLPVAWAYCADHMYGRKIIDGVVYIRVHRDSPAAKNEQTYTVGRGFLESVAWTLTSGANPTDHQQRWAAWIRELLARNPVESTDSEATP